MKKSLLSLLLVLFTLSSFSQNKRKQQDPFIDSLQHRTLQWFLDVTPDTTGLTPDRWPAPWSPASIAAAGFALTTYPIAVERKMITRAEAARRTLNTLRFFWHLPQHEHATNTSGYKGFYYHFLKIEGGLREWNSELSTIDTGLLMAVLLFCQ